MKTWASAILTAVFVLVATAGCSTPTQGPTPTPTPEPTGWQTTVEDLRSELESRQFAFDQREDQSGLPALGGIQADSGSVVLIGGLSGEPTYVFVGFKRPADLPADLLEEQKAILEFVLTDTLPDDVTAQVKAWLDSKMDSGDLDDATAISGWEIALHIQGEEMLIGVSYQP